MTGPDAAETAEPGTGRGLVRRAVSRFGWFTVVVAVPLVALCGVFTTSRIFYVRDLSFVRWPEHLWFRDAIAHGSFPMWDPYVGFGQSAIADPARHLLFPPVLLLRALLPTVVGFNLSVALPFPVAALGMFLFLRRRIEPAAAALGAIVFSVSGPVLSTGNFINMTWAVALIPWVVLAADRCVEAPAVRRFAVLAAAFALQFLAGEAVTVVATAVLVVVYSVVAPEAGAAWRRRVLSAVAAIGAGVTALLLAAVQALPLAGAISRSSRSGTIHPGMLSVWTLHPLSMLEFVTPALFGDPLASGDQSSLWLGALNSGREPFMLSTYLGIVALSLALAGAVGQSEKRLRRFWAGVFVVALLCALGQHTPVYPALQWLVPPAQALRYSSKYTVFVAFAAAVLAGFGWRSLFVESESRVPWIAAAGLLVAGSAVAAVSGIASLLTPDMARNAFASLAGAVGASSPDLAGAFLVKSVSLGAPRLVVLSLGALGACWLGRSARPDARLGRVVLFVMIAADLVVSGIDLNPTIDAGRMGQPAWVRLTREHPGDRIYIGGRLSSAYDYRSDPDDPVPEKGLEVTEDPTIAVSAMSSVFFATFPSAWKVRDSMSYDNNLLWPREYGLMVRAFRDSPHESRIAYLGRSGVRYYLVPWRDWAARTLEDFPDRSPLGLYEGPEPRARASIATAVIVEPDSAAALKMLFAQQVAPETVLLDSSPEPDAERVNPGGVGTADIVSDEAGEVRVNAMAPASGGYLVLRDTFTPDWTAEVDGTPVAILRADVLFRAVRIDPGAHAVVFRYSPRSIRTGGAISMLTVLVLLGICLAGLFRRTA